MNVYKKLVNNSFIFAIGNLGSKVIVFFLVPLYTYYLTTSEFGMVDLIISTTNLLLPIISLSIFESVLRFTMDSYYDRQAILINAIVVTIIGFLILIIFYPIINWFFPIKDYIIYLYLLLFIQSTHTTIMQYIRAKGLIRLYAISGIINALVLLISNIIFLVLVRCGIQGYLISQIIAVLISMIFITIKGKVQKEIIVKKINFNLIKEMLIFSIPLIPNSLMYSIMSFTDRYVISLFLGVSSNGLYAVANKIPSIIYIINSIFFQAWQMSAIEESDSKEKSKFFSNVFNVFSIFMLISTSFLIVNLKVIMKFLVADSFFSAWKYVPFLLLSAVFSSFSGFLGTNYIAEKKTTGLFKTSVIGALINVSLNIVLIPIIGIYGASIGALVSFVVIWIIRIKDTQQFVNIVFNVRKLIFILMVIFLQIEILYLNSPYEYLIQLVLFLAIVIINFSEIKLISGKFFTLIISKK